MKTKFLLSSICVFLSLIACTTRNIKIFQSPSIEGNWTLACIECSDPAPFNISFLSTGYVFSQDNVLCTRILDNVHIKACELSWTRKKSINELKLKSGQVVLSFNIRLIDLAGSDFFEFILEQSSTSMILGRTETRFLFRVHQRNMG